MSKKGLLETMLTSRNSGSLQQKAEENDKHWEHGEISGFPSEAEWHKGMKDPSIGTWENELTKHVAAVSEALAKDTGTYDALMEFVKWVGVQLKLKEKADDTVCLLSKYHAIYPEEKSMNEHRKLDKVLGDHADVVTFAKTILQWNGEGTLRDFLEGRLAGTDGMVDTMRGQLQNYFRQFETLRDEAKTWKEKYDTLIALSSGEDFILRPSPADTSHAASIPSIYDDVGTYPTPKSSDVQLRAYEAFLAEEEAQS